MFSVWSRPYYWDALLYHIPPISQPFFFFYFFRTAPFSGGEMHYPGFFLIFPGRRSGTQTVLANHPVLKAPNGTHLIQRTQMKVSQLLN